MTKMDMKEKVKKALLAEAADLSFGMSGYSYVGASAEELDEARRAKKKKEEESETETSLKKLHQEFWGGLLLPQP